MKFSKVLVTSVVLLVLMALLAGCAAPAPPAPAPVPTAAAPAPAPKPAPSPVSAPQPSKEVRLITHNVGGTFHTASVGVAKVISDNTPIKVVVIPTQGPLTYMPMLNSGEADIGFPNELDAYYGFVSNQELGYKQRNTNIRMLLPGGNIPPGLIPLVVRKDSPFKTIADLKGKRVAGGFSGNKIMWYQMQAHLALGGLEYKDVVEVPVTDYTAALTALRENRVDATFGGTYYGAATLELNAAIGLRVMPMDPGNPAYFKRFKELLPGFDAVKVGPDMWLTDPTYAFTYKTSLITNAQFSEDTAYTIVKCIYDNYQKVAALGGNVKTWEPKVFFNPEPNVPYHPGTVKYYKEKGIWTPAVDKIQADLMAKAK